MATTSSRSSFSLGRRGHLAVLAAATALVAGLLAADTALEELAGAAHAAAPSHAARVAEPETFSGFVHEAAVRERAPHAAERRDILDALERTTDADALLAMERRLMELDAAGD